MSRGQYVDALTIAVKERLTLAFEREKAKRGRYSVRQFVEETPELAGHKDRTVAGWMKQTKQRLAQVSCTSSSAWSSQLTNAWCWYRRLLTQETIQKMFQETIQKMILSLRMERAERSSGNASGGQNGESVALMAAHY